MMGDVSRLGCGRKDGLLHRIPFELATSAECVEYFWHDRDRIAATWLLLAFDLNASLAKLR
jgi:hypothetical protein